MSGGQNEDDLYQEIKDIVSEETLYLRHFNGKVSSITDIYKIGRVQVILEDLGFYTAEEAIWAHPRQSHSMILPKLGDYVDVYFTNGDSGKPRYTVPSSEIQGMGPKTWNGVTTDSIIFEHPGDKSLNLTVKNGKLVMLEGAEAMVLGDSLKSDIQSLIDSVSQLQTDLSSWVPTPNDGGAALKTILTTGFLTSVLPTLSSILSKLIKVK